MSSRRTPVQTKWRKYETVCLATTTLLDTPDSDGPSNTPQWRTPIRHVTGPEPRWFHDKGQHTGSEKSGASAYYANFTSVEDYGSDDEKVELVDASQAHNDPADSGSDVGEEALDCDDDEENDTCSSYVALDDVSVFEAAELDAIALLADTWDNDLDPEVSAQLVQANVQAHLSFGKEKGKGKAKGKHKLPVFHHGCH